MYDINSLQGIALALPGGKITFCNSSNAFQAISLAEHDINDVDCELKLDYKV